MTSDHTLDAKRCGLDCRNPLYNALAAVIACSLILVMRNTKDVALYVRRPQYATALESRTEAYVWPDVLGRDTDSAEDLAQITIPGFWIPGG